MGDLLLIVLLMIKDLLTDGLFDKSNDTHRLLSRSLSIAGFHFLTPDIPWVMCLETFYIKIWKLLPEIGIIIL